MTGARVFWATPQYKSKEEENIISFRKKRGSTEKCGTAGQQAAFIPETAVAARSDSLFHFSPNPSHLECSLYESLRRSVPIIDACIGKLVRLVGDFRLKAADERMQAELDYFCDNVSVNTSGASLGVFIDTYLDSLITYGKAVGEVVIDGETGEISGLANGDSSILRIKRGKTPLEARYFILDSSNELEITHPERILCSILNESPKNPEGVSLLRGLPCFADVLMRIYRCIGQNFDRVGNVRYAVTYKPSSDSCDRAFARERAQQIAKEWSDGMTSQKNGIVKDFIAVGDVDIKVIGADNQLIDTEIPVRQLLQQLISKLSIPPFLLGLNWSSTERMSTQQVDILTSELEYYRRILTPVIKKIGRTFLSLRGSDSDVSVEWSNINLQDETELSKARLYNAQAEEIELRNRKTREEEGYDDGIYA